MIMRLLVATILASACGSMLFLSGCNACSPRLNPDELREKTAQATATLKQDARAIAQGVREGMARNNLVDLNTGTRKQFTTLPGITDEQADRIIANRPYGAPGELVTKNVLSRQEYNRIRDRVTVKK